MRVGVLATSYPRTPSDWAGHFVSGLARWMERQGATVEVIAAGPGMHRDGSIAITRIANPLFYGGGAPEALERSLGAWGHAARFATRFGLAALRRARSWDAIVSHWLLPSGLLGAALARSKPHVAIAHSADVALLERFRAGRLAARALAGSQARMVFASQSLRERFGRLCGRVVGSSVPMGAEGPRGDFETPRDPFSVLFLGRLVSIKGLDCLLDAAAGLPGVKFIVAGQGPELVRLRRRASPNVLFRGEVLGAAKWQLLREAHVVCIPSIALPGGRTEGTPTVLGEACAAGRPVVASATGGLPDAVGDAGLLVAPGDARALRQALALLGRDRALWTRLARRAHAKAPRWDWSAVAPQILGQQLVDRIRAQAIQ